MTAPAAHTSIEKPNTSIRIGSKATFAAALLWVFLRGMFFPMTLKKASASKEALVFEFQPSGAWIWKYYGGVKINEVAIVRGVALAETDTVGIVTC